MYKNHLIAAYIFLFFFTGLTNSQAIDKADSALIKKYWNRVNIKSLTSLSSNLYNGIDNYITLICPDQESAAFQFYLTTNNGSIYEYDDGSYLVLPSSTGKAFISIKIITSRNDTLLIGKKHMNVIQLPIPSLKIGNTILSEKATIDKQVFENKDTLKLFFTDDLPESNSWYKIEWFSVGYTYGSIYKSVDNYSSVFKEDTKKLIKQACNNCELVIKVHTVSPSGILKQLPLIRFSAISKNE